jgi:GNAT superfamily N-acetyltransferase
MSLSCLAPSVELRTLEPGEADAVLEVFEGLGPRSRTLRFLTAKPRLTSTDLRQLTDVDGRDHVAVLAVSDVDSRIVGVARFVRDPSHPESADVAVAVVDDWQGVGVGTFLAGALVERAREVGVHRFTMVMSADNEGAVRLLHRMPGHIERLSLDEEHAEFALDVGGPA